ncbi:ABC transporter substrate-binding protein, partial [Schnuerera sp.]|uniref:ABC transporter substrate-binding protein n=1 Tax=Schnuerera sp. TaxID=2794844 RepID=UPI002B8AC3E1
MDRVLSVSIGEITLKGKNRKYFEDKLISKMIRAIKGLDYTKIYKEQGKIYIEAKEDNFESMINKLKKVFGTDDPEAVRAAMAEKPINDFFARNGRIREDGRMVHDMYLVQVNTPQE